jgi:hypothetical protein
MDKDLRKTVPVTGRLAVAGRMVVDGRSRFGFFVEANGLDMLSAGNLRLLGRRVVIKQDGRASGHEVSAKRQEKP